MNHDLFVLIVLAPCCGTGIKRRGERSGHSARMEELSVTLEEELPNGSQREYGVRRDNPNPA